MKFGAFGMALVQLEGAQHGGGVGHRRWRCPVRKWRGDDAWRTPAGGGLNQAEVPPCFCISVCDIQDIGPPYLSTGLWGRRSAWPHIPPSTFLSSSPVLPVPASPPYLPPPSPPCCAAGSDWLPGIHRGNVGVAANCNVREQKPEE